MRNLRRWRCGLGANGGVLFGGEDLKRALIAGFGNLYRRDDGAGMEVVNMLRRHQGQRPLDFADDGYGDLGHGLDTLVLHQLVPEFAETMAEYDRVILVDAHVTDVDEPIREQHIEPVYCSSSFVSHQTRPHMLLHLVQSMCGQVPETTMLSLRGHDFDFGEGLSPETALLVPLAVERILALVGAD